MFADYRVPQLLRQLGVLRYSGRLAELVDGKQELAAGGAAEAELRGCTVHAVEMLRGAVAARASAAAEKLTAIALDWHLWEAGEAARHTLPPHHRTRTVYY